MKTILRLCKKIVTAGTFVLTLPLYLFAIFLYPAPEENWLERIKGRNLP